MIESKEVGNNAVIEIPRQSDMMPVQDMIIRFQLVLDAQKQVMKEGLTRDYGIIPGTSKPTLLKPGAEKLCAMFRLAPEFSIQTIALEGEHREVIATCALRHGPTGVIAATAHGSASTKESKYRWRQGSRKCPMGTGR